MDCSLGWIGVLLFEVHTHLCSINADTDLEPQTDWLVLRWWAENKIKEASRVSNPITVNELLFTGYPLTNNYLILAHYDNKYKETSIT